MDNFLPYALGLSVAFLVGSRGNGIHQNSYRQSSRKYQKSASARKACTLAAKVRKGCVCIADCCCCHLTIIGCCRAVCALLIAAAAT
eukprot:1142502-Pelagomonas_calceolata.AAC.1